MIPFVMETHTHKKNLKEKNEEELFLGSGITID